MEAKLRNGKCLLWPLNGYLTRTIPSEDVGCIARTAISAGLDSMVLQQYKTPRPSEYGPAKQGMGLFTLANRP